MLILTRKCGQSVIIGEDVEIKILDISEEKVSIGIIAPRNISIARKELLEVKGENIKAAVIDRDKLNKLKKIIKKR